MAAPCEVCGGLTGANDPKCSGCGAGIEAPVEEKTKAELVDEARELDLPVSGTKEEIAERIAEAQSEGRPDPTGGSNPDK
jgi:hypothetical protein